MIHGDPDNRITWWSVVLASFVAGVIFWAFRQGKDLKKITGFEPIRRAAQTVPVLTTDDVDRVYARATTQRASSRINNLILAFSKKFVGQTPDFIVRAPGRVNLIGEHIDYCGYDVLPMAVEKDILFAVKVVRPSESRNIIQLCNTESTFTPIQLDLTSKDDTTIKLGVENRHWSIYFLAAFHGICSKYDHLVDVGNLKSLKIMADGNVPKGSGLSSSSAFVCGSAVSLLFANLEEEEFSELGTAEIAECCIECERRVGVDSGGMDQTICMMAHKGYAKYIEFRPELRGTDIKLPPMERTRWVIANCLKEHKLQDESGTQNYNTRVVECRLAALLLAKELKLRQWRSVMTFRDIQEMTGLKLDVLLFKTMDLLNNESYSIEQIEDDLDVKALGITLEDLMVGLKRGKSVLKNLRTLTKYRLPLQNRALHVYGEASRVQNFKDLCTSTFDLEDGELPEYGPQEERVVSRLGKLMTDSHVSCRDKYECSCEELDELQSLCIEGGALGSRLTGAGWGGCIVSLVEEEKVKAFKAYLNKNYYASIPKVPLNHQFTTSPSAGLTVLKIENDE